MAHLPRGCCSAQRLMCASASSAMAAAVGFRNGHDREKRFASPRPCQSASSASQGKDIKAASTSWS